MEDSLLVMIKINGELTVKILKRTAQFEKTGNDSNTTFIQGKNKSENTFCLIGCAILTTATTFFMYMSKIITHVSIALLHTNSRRLQITFPEISNEG